MNSSDIEGIILRALRDGQWKFNIHSIVDYTVAYNIFATRDFIRLMKELGSPEHHIHDTRHTFITVARNHIEKLLLQKIVGHKPEDITDEVYTHIEFSQLLTAINSMRKI